MKVPSFKIDDAVKMIPDSGWRGVIVKKHPHRNNGFKVRTTDNGGNPFCAAEFWVRPISLAHVGDE